MTNSKTSSSTVEGDTSVISELVHGASDAAIAIDDRQRVAGWNRIAEQLLGYKAEEVMGRPCAEVLQATLPGGEPLCVPTCEAFRCFLNCHAFGVTECRARRKNGDWVSVGISSLVLPRTEQRPGTSKIVAIELLREKQQKHVDPQPRGALQIFALGGFGVTASGCTIAVENWKRKQAVTLLKFLVTQLDRPVHRERILDCLWPDVDEERAWGRLKVTMYYMRSQLRAAGIGDDVVRTIGDAYLLRRDALWLDAEIFEKLVTEGRALQDQERWEEALRCYEEASSLYRGDYLEQDIFADWCAEERERLREICLEMLSRKAECHAQSGQYAHAVQVCRKALVHDPCRENLHVALMEYLLCLGHPDRALAQYRHCETVLAREFGVAPMPETRRLYQQIVDGAGFRLPAAPAASSRERDHAHAPRAVSGAP